MAWQSGPQDLKNLATLGNLTARLLRLVLFEKLSVGEAQLKSYGIDASITPLYKEFALNETKKLYPSTQKEKRFVKTKTTERSVF